MTTWLIIIIILTFIEALTTELVSIWFIASAIISLIISVFIDNFTIEFACFVLLGTILLLTTRKYLINKLTPKKVKTNYDRIIGETGIVTQDIDLNQNGEVKVDGKYWTATSKEKIISGTYVVILDIEGVKLKVKRSEKE